MTDSHKIIQIGKMVFRKEGKDIGLDMPVVIYSLTNDPNEWIYAECLPIGQVGTGRTQEEAIEDLHEIINWYIKELENPKVEIVPSPIELHHFYVNSKNFIDQLKKVNVTLPNNEKDKEGIVFQYAQISSMFGKAIFISFMSGIKLGSISLIFSSNS